ncbi:hypothetical protein [Rickettsia felis]|uniref:hypothetical protein n=1 Tax=Rickettsia felis TaxID=42862 RepID=UPI001F46C21C|nr:hypothetical protein [Rickettsia felis]
MLNAIRHCEEALLCGSVFPSLQGNYVSNCTSAISGICYYFMRLPRGLRPLTITMKQIYPINLS